MLAFSELPNFRVPFLCIQRICLVFVFGETAFISHDGQNAYKTYIHNGTSSIFNNIALIRRAIDVMFCLLFLLVVPHFVFNIFGLTLFRVSSLYPT